MNGDDCTVVAKKSSGKLTCVLLSFILIAYQAESRREFLKGEGPFCILLMPTRDLVYEAYDKAKEMSSWLYKNDTSLPKIKICLLSEELPTYLHFVIATPDQLEESLRRNRINLDGCHHVCYYSCENSLLENRLSKYIYEDTQLIRCSHESLLSHSTGNLLKLLPPDRFDLIQESVFLDPESRVLELLERIQKSPPPTVVIVEGKRELEDLCFFLQSKGLLCGSSLESQQLRDFKEHKLDILLSSHTNLISFLRVKHVIFYEIPREFDDYLAVGDWFASDSIGMISVFITRRAAESSLRRYAQFLRTSLQPIPSYLQNL